MEVVVTIKTGGKFGETLAFEELIFDGCTGLKEKRGLPFAIKKIKGWCGGCSMWTLSPHSF